MKIFYTMTFFSTNMIFKTPPDDFSPSMDVVACFVLSGEKYLCMQYTERKGAEWGVPGGKRDLHETRKQAMIRELQEETGFSVSEIDIEEHITFPIRYPDFDFWYTIYSTRLSTHKEPSLDQKEHQAYSWKTPSEALKLNLILDEDACIKYFFYGQLPWKS